MLKIMNMMARHAPIVGGFILTFLTILSFSAKSQDQQAAGCSDDCTAFIREIIAIATREVYCHTDSKCSNASIGQVRSLEGGSVQCENTIFGPTGVQARYRGNSFQWVSGQCFTFNTAGEPVVASNTPPLPLAGIALPAIWTGLSCYTETDCRGSRAAVVYNWDDCKNGSYPDFDNVPGKINGKSILWGTTCIGLR